MIRQENVNVLNEEMPFEIAELFFSTTDTKGIIRTCNDVFLRVSGFQPEELLAKPHNIIRHPDMPRCVFYLLWDYLLSGKPIGAYVKNRAKNGKYYWVYALASPMKDGFISVRLKPTSDLFDTVRKLYAELLSIERSYSSWKDGMAASTSELLKRLQTLGFETYTDFMNATLRAEMLSRDSKVASSSRESRTPDDEKVLVLKRIFLGLDSLLQLKSTLRSKEAFFLTLGTHISRVAMNASVRAAHLAESGRSLSAISEEVSRISGEIERDSDVLRSRSGELAEGIGEVSFHIAQAILQSQAKLFFAAEQARNELPPSAQSARYGAPVDDIVAELSGCVHDSLSRSVNGIATLKTAVGGFEEIARSLEKILLTIQFSYVTGKTLTARIDSGDTFAALLADMVSLSESARDEVCTLRDSVARVKKDISQWNALSLR
ncbi:MAG: PAS domain-containing protein [Bdellovibrionota bacterium]